MAGAATAAYSADVLASSGVDGHQQQWEYAVPAPQDVSFILMLNAFVGR